MLTRGKKMAIGSQLVEFVCVFRWHVLCVSPFATFASGIDPLVVDNRQKKELIMLKNKSLALALASVGLAAPLAHAEEPASPHSVTGNLTFATDYIVRGLSQTNKKPAVQGTVEYGHASGFYAGVFGSNVSWPADGWEPAAVGVDGSIYGGYSGTNVSASYELDLYAGLRNKFFGDFSYDVGAVYYWYPGKYQLSAVPGLKRPDTAEVYAGLGWKWLTAKVWYAVSDGVFMVPDARGTYYANLSATVPIGETGFNIVGAVGTWKWSGEAEYLKTTASTPGYGAKNSIYDLVDYKIGVTKDFLGFNWGAFYWGSTADKTYIGTSGGTGAAWGNRFGTNICDYTFFAQAPKSF
ncbi:MAG: TorF family putative porin [Betaproteobacteria bacterium]